MKIWRLFYTLWQGRQENKRRKKEFSLLKCIQKSNVIKKKWVLVFIFMYLVLVDAMDWSQETILEYVQKLNQRSKSIFQVQYFNSKDFDL